MGLAARVLDLPGSWEASVTPDGQLRLRTPDGQYVRVRGRIIGPRGKDGKDGDPGPPPAVEVIAKAVYSYLKHFPPAPGKDGRDGRHGVDGKPGEPGRPPSKKEVYDAVQAFLRDHPIPVPKDGKDGLDGVDGRDGTDGKPGDPGPLPRHQLDPEDKPYRIRFEVERLANGKSRWGEWIDLRKLLPTMAPRRSHGVGGTLDERRIRNMIQEAIVASSTTSPLSGYRIADEDSSGDVKYYGYTKDDSPLWYVLQVDHSVDPITYRYSRGSADYATNWTNRAGLTYSRLTDLSGF